MMSTSKNFLGSLSIILVVSLITTVIAIEPELRLVSVVFRHGDRTPDNNGLEMYPKDPYVNCTFYPMGLGQLTNKGKRREYSLGEVLRLQYSKFLGSIYIPSAIEARSTDYDRTKMSLQLVLSSLYPPEGIQKWNNELPWQPIPFSYVVEELDNLLVPEECPLYLAEYERVKKTPEVRKKVSVFDDLMKNLTLLTGKKISNTLDLYYLYHTFMAESSMDLTLPDWANNIFPHGDLFDGTVLEYDIISYNTALKRLNGGMLVRKISEDMAASADGSLEKGRKIFLYSGHETNIAAVQQTLGVYLPHVPEYSSAQIFELLELNNTYYVRILYYTGIPPSLKEQTIPGCDVLCPLDTYLELLSDVIPSDKELICKKAEVIDPMQGTSGKNGFFENLIKIITQKIWPSQS